MCKKQKEENKRGLCISLKYQFRKVAPDFLPDF